MVKVRGKKKWYDGEADWVPAEGRQSVMKGQKQGVEGKIKNDGEGMDKAYEQGDTYVEDNKWFVAGSHTATDFF